MTGPTAPPPNPPPARHLTMPLATIAGLLAATAVAIALTPWWYLVVTPAGIATSIAAGHWIQNRGRR